MPQKVSLAIFFSFFFLFSQEVGSIIQRSSFPKQIEELNYLFNEVQKDFRKGIIEGSIPSDMSYTKLATYGFSEIQINYIDNILQAIFLEDIGFRLIKIEELFLTRTIDDSKARDVVSRVKGVKDNREYLEITREVGNKNFIEFYFYRFKNSIRVRVFIHDAETTEVIWFGEWSVETRKSNFVSYIDFSLNLISFPLMTSIWNSQRGGLLNAGRGRLGYMNLGFFLGGRQVGFGDYGVRIKLGYESDSTFILQGNALLFIGPQLNFNVLEIAGVNKYEGISFYLAIDVSLLLSFNIFSPPDAVSPPPRFLPQTLLSSSLGAFVVIDSFLTIGLHFDYLLMDLNIAFGFKI